MANIENLHDAAASVVVDQQHKISTHDKNFNDLIFRLGAQNEAHLQEILSSPQLQREIELYYQNASSGGVRSDLVRLRRKREYDESQISVTDSEFYCDDQYQDVAPNIYGGDNSDKEKVAANLSRVGRFFELLSRLPLPRMSCTGMGICFLIGVFICPRACVENLLFPAFRLLFGTLYPAYASYKAVRTKNVKEYVKWMMYWIVYAFFTCIETFTDIFLSWFPFYYEVKVIIVIWLLSPATKGSSTLYRKFVHPMLTRKEQEIDEYINQAKEKGYTAVLQLGSKGVNYATNVIMQTALKGGGNLVQSIRRSYSLSDLSEPDVHRTQDEVDEISRPQRFLRPRTQTARSSSGGRHMDMYFSEVDVATKSSTPNYNYIRSSEDISSGYSSAEPVSGGLSRTSSMTNASRTRIKSKRTEEEDYLNANDINILRNLQVSKNLPQIVYLRQQLPTNFKSQNPAAPADKNLVDVQKRETFLDNEKYFQDIKDENITKNLADETSSSTNIDYATNLENLLPNEEAEKYKMFCKWLEDSKKFIDIDQSSTTTKDTELQEIASLPYEDEFKDTISIESDDDVFIDANISQIDNTQDSKLFEFKHSIHKLENILEQSKPKGDPFSKVVVEGEACMKPEERQKNEMDVKVCNQNKFSELEYNIDHKALSIDDNMSCNSSITDLTKRALHNKGKAPEPPSISKLIQEPKLSLTICDMAQDLPQLINPKSVLPAEQQDLNLVTSPPKVQNNPTAVPEIPSGPKIAKQNLDASSSSMSVRAPHSRSQSPKPDSSKKTKKGFLKNYLPSIFRPESPKPTSGDDYPKETQI